MTPFATTLPIETSDEVQDAMDSGTPIVALETSLVAQGLPIPWNLECARGAMDAIREESAVPATIGLVKGTIKVGLDMAELEELAVSPGVWKVGRSSIALAVESGADGGTTVSGTMAIAHRVGLRYFATGGIGGVHRGARFTWDISEDISALGRIPLVVVCSGAKSILDLPATLESLESAGVTTVGYCTDVWPAFYCRSTKHPLPLSVTSPHPVARIHDLNEQLGLTSAVLVANPVPHEWAVDEQVFEGVLSRAMEAATRSNISGKAVTPFLLSAIAQEIGPSALRANTELVIANARLAARIARARAEAIAGD